MVPVGMAVIGDVYSPGKRPSALGTLGAIDTAGWVWGPLYGALLIRFLDWRWQFYLNIPLSIVAIAATWWALRDLPKPKPLGRIDWLGSILLTGGLLSLSIALLNGNDIQTAGSLAELTGEQPPNMMPLYLIALACFVLFLIVEYRISTKATGIFNWASGTFPLIDPSLFKRQNFSPSVMVNFLVGAVLIIAMINVPLLVNVLETDVAQAALTSGWLLSAMTASMAVMAYVGGRLTERFSYRPVTIAGLLAIVLGFSLMGISWQVDTASRQMVWQLVVLGTGFGLVIAPIGAAVINAAPEDQRGVASGLVIVFRLIGMSVGLSGLTAWGLHRFEELRQSIDLPPITDPDFQAALIDGLSKITVDVLAETFLISALIAAVAVLTALPLQPDLEITPVAELGQDLPE